MRRIFLNKYKKIHIIGIGGIGMSGIARIFKEYGFEVSGSDLNKSPITESLENIGITVYYGHKALNVVKKDLIIYSSAVKADNPEIVAAKKSGVTIVNRNKALRELSRIGNCVAVAGTHGKTTTSGIIGKIFKDSGLMPAILIGGNLPYLNNNNAELGKGDFIILEADEYDRAFLSILPDVAIITSVEPEHLDIYGDFNGIKKAFIEFANSLPFYGNLFADISNEGVKEILPEISSNTITYGIGVKADVEAFDIKVKENATLFKVKYFGENLGEFKIKLLGLHNVKNSLAAISAAYNSGIKIDEIKKSLEEFVGAERRFQILRNEYPIIIDDYAHHPTEIAATLNAARSFENSRLIAVFQPHLFSRTKLFYKEFARALKVADWVILMDIYPAREKPIEGVSSKLIYDELKKSGFENVIYLEDTKNLIWELNNLLMENDVVVGLGAGNITYFIRQLAGNINRIKKDVNGNRG